MAHLTNPLATPDQLYKRSQFSALPTDLQDLIFFQSQTLTQAAGLLLQLPQSVTAQANVLLARFWLVEPFLSHEFSSASAASLLLVAKVGPSPASARNIANVYTYLLSDHSTLFRDGTKGTATTKQPPDDVGSYTPSEIEYNRFHSSLLALEARILYALSFDTHVALPHPLAVTYLQALDFFELAGREAKNELGGLAARYLNTALLSPQQLYVTHQPPAMAVAAVYNAARDVGAKMPECEWWQVFDVEREELGFLVVAMRSLEGWVQRVKDDGLVGGLREGMVTRRAIEGEMERRGLRMGNGHGKQAEEVLDEEEKMARLMDQMIAEQEADGIVEGAEDQV